MEARTTGTRWIEQRLEIALEQTALLQSPDEDGVNTFLVDAYRQAWGW
jgi:hypothetical protein